MAGTDPESAVLDTAGLTSERARALFTAGGPNLLPAPGPVPHWKKLAAELTHFFALMLWVAAALAFIAGMPQLGIAVLIVVLVNGFFAYFQEERAERAAIRLRELLPSQAVVRRDGRAVTVDAAELVVGDVVLLAAGDRIPADLKFAVAAHCTVDESMLTGESEPVPKTRADPAWGGTFLVNGEAEGVIVATGGRTKLAGIAALTTAVRPPLSPLNLELRRIVRIIAAVALSMGGVFFVVSLLVGISWRDAFLFAIGVAVALIPEGLLPTVTLSLAMGAQRMAGRKALVRHLQAVETLGSTTYICTDKTGTLTQNRMSAVEVWTPAGVVTIAGTGYDPTAAVQGPRAAVAQAQRLARGAAVASQGRIVEQKGRWTAFGDPMEAAIDALAHRLSGSGEGTGSPPGGAPAYRFAFDPVRRRESVIVGSTLWLKGAPEAVLPLCAGIGPDGRAQPAGPGDGCPPTGAGRVLDAVEEMASRGLRVLAVAEKQLLDAQVAAAGRGVGPETLETDLILLGLIGLHDPPRSSAAEAVRGARAAGIKIAMVTGDHPSTAAAIAREVGLMGPEGTVLVGDSLPADDQALGSLLDRDGVVVSRVSPEQKLRVARALQQRGHVLAMTGDGVNDGPALHQADIGVAMGMTGTDVAREAADMVLLDDDFATMVAAVEQGRATYANIRRFLTYHLTDNVAELTPFVVWALTGGQFPLALGVLQILCLDIGTDLLPALALGNERPSRGVLTRPPERRHLMDGAVMVRVFGVLGPTEALVEMAAFVAVLWAAGWRFGASAPADLLAASGAAFTAVVLGQLANAFACRSATWPPWRLGWLSNRMLLWCVLVELAALALFLYVGPLAALLGQAPPTTGGAAVALLAIPAVLAADYLQKTARRRRRGVRAPLRAPGQPSARKRK